MLGAWCLPSTLPSTDGGAMHPDDQAQAACVHESSVLSRRISAAPKESVQPILHSPRNAPECYAHSAVLVHDRSDAKQLKLFRRQLDGAVAQIAVAILYTSNDYSTERTGTGHICSACRWQLPGCPLMPNGPAQAALADRTASSHLGQICQFPAKATKRFWHVFHAPLKYFLYVFVTHGLIRIYAHLAL